MEELWIILIENSDGRVHSKFHFCCKTNNEFPVRYNNKESAIKAAEGMARICKGMRIYLMRSVACCESEKPPMPPVFWQEI